MNILRILFLIVVMAGTLFFMHRFGINEVWIRLARIELNANIANREDDFIKWMEFNIPLDMLKLAYNYDINSQNSQTPHNWIELLAYTAAKNWGNFNEKSGQIMSDVVKRLENGELMYDISRDLRLYNYYLEIFSAVLASFVGLYEIVHINDEGEEIRELRYGLRTFFPIAAGYYYEHYDDFGNPRTYGYKRRHLGHDIFGEVGIPIIAVEDGIIEALGWNRYGGWRIGIRSFDGRRYYYYAHLRRDRPFAEGLEIGMQVQAGDVIGYLGKTGYSTRENVNNINVPHLHFGLQIIFDESQKDSGNEIWIDTYNIIRFLKQNRMIVVKGEDGEFRRGVEVNFYVE